MRAVASGPVASGPVVSPPVRGPEIPSFRTRDSDTYLTAGGMYAAQVYPGPVNYRAADGSWQPIDDSLDAVSGGFVNRADSYKAFFPSSLGSAPLRVSEGGRQVSVELQGASGAAGVSGSRVRYDDALPGVSVSYRSEPGEVDESLSLSDPSVGSIKFVVGLSSGLSAVEHAGTVLVKDVHGDTVFAMPQPALLEASAAGPPLPSDVGGVSVSLKAVVGGVQVTYTPDHAWLSASGRSFPVILDPSISTTANPSADCSIYSGAPTSNRYCGSGGWDYLGYSASSGAMRTMISFAGGLGIPADSQVLGASLSIDVGGFYPSQTSIPWEVHEMTRQFTPGAATWNSYDGQNAWATPGGDFGSAVQWSGSLSSTGWASIDVTPMAQAWLDGSYTVPSLMLTAPSGYQGSELWFYQHASGSDGPHLTIYFVPRIGDQRGLTVEQTALNDRMKLGTNVANGNLMVTANDLHVQGTGLDESVDRTYNSFASGLWGSWGLGWGGTYATTTGASLRWLVNDSVAIMTPDGTWTVWDRDGKGGFIAPPGVDGRLCWWTTPSSDGGCPGLPSGDDAQLTFRDGERWEFDSYQAGCGCYREVDDSDQNANHVSYRYGSGSGGPTGTLASIGDTHGRTTSFSYTPSAYVSGITDNAGGRSTSYAQDANGRLTGFTDTVGKTTSYAYDSSGNLIQITDPAGEITKLAYDGSGRVTSVTRVTNNQTEAGDTTTYAYYAPQSAPVECTVSGGLGWYGETVKVDPNGNQTIYCYDTHDRVFETFDALGYHTQQTYDGDDNVTASQDPLANQSQSTYDNCERASQAIAPLALPGVSTVPATTTAGYDGTACAAGQTPPSTTSDWEPATGTDPQGNTISYGYDSNGNLSTETLPLAGSPQLVTHHVLANQCKGQARCYGLMDYSKDADGHQTNYSYYTSGYNAGDLQTTTPPSPLGATTDSYDADSRVISQTDGKGQTTALQYDALDRLTRETRPDGSTTTYTYDADGNLLSQVDSSSGTSTYTYDLKNRMASEASPGVANTYSYDGADNLKSVTDAGGTVTYDYDKDNRVRGVQEPSVTNPTSLAYDADSRRICTTSPNGVVVQNRYDNVGDLLSTKAANGPAAACNPQEPSGTPSGSLFSSYGYTYDQNGADRTLRQSLSLNGGSPFSFSYNGLNRLTEWNGGDLPGPLYYTFDPAGNITRMDKLSAGTIKTTTYSYNNANEITDNGYGYDADGNLLTRPDTGGTTSLGYNTRNQTTSVNPDQSGAQTLGYLGHGQRQPTQIGNAPPLGGTAPTLENNKLGISSQATAAPVGQQPQTTYYTRDSTGTLLGERTPSGRYYYAEDANGSVIALTDQNGNLANTYTYDPWGDTTSSTGSAPNSFAFDQGFQSQAGLYHFGERYYDPGTGSWTQQDPVTHLDDPNQADLYSFAGDDPLNRTDTCGTYSRTRCIYACIENHCHNIGRAYRCITTLHSGLHALHCLASACNLWRLSGCVLGCGMGGGGPSGGGRFDLRRFAHRILPFLVLG